MCKFENEVKNCGVWDEVCHTNPKHTKDFMLGTKKMTSISPTWFAMRATQLFGPCGIGWGYSIEDEKILDGHPLVLNKDQCILQKLHVVRVKLWYKWNGERGEVTHFGQTPLVSCGNGGFYTDEEAPKKSLTDALSKCFSMLGFGADIYLGYFEDPEYVGQATQHFAEKAAEKQMAEGQSSEAQAEDDKGQAELKEEVSFAPGAVPVPGVDISAFSELAQTLITRVRNITELPGCAAARAHAVRLQGIEKEFFLKTIEAVENSLKQAQNVLDAAAVPSHG